MEPIPLDSPRWAELSACWSAEAARAALAEIVATRRLGEPWSALCDEILHQGSVFDVSSAVIPHLVDLVGHLTTAERRAVWIEIGFLVTAGAGPGPGPAGTVRDFLADRDLPAGDVSYYALACVALAGHRVGHAMWEFLSPGAGYARVLCPGCAAEYETDGFGDPFAPPGAAAFGAGAAAFGAGAAAFGAGAAVDGPWGAVAEAVAQPDVFGPGWDGFRSRAAEVATAGVPADAPADAVWGLVAAMVATRAPAWGRTLARLTGLVHCPECDTTWRLADVLGQDGPVPGVEPVDGIAGADGRLGFRPAPGFVPGPLELPALPALPALSVPAPGTFESRSAVVDTDTVTVPGGLTVEVAYADGRRSEMAPPPDKLAGIGHERLVGVTAFPGHLGHKPIALADANGTVSLWETFGVRLADPLPPDPAHRDVVGVATVDRPGGLLVVTASRTDRNLRVWDPAQGTAALLPWDATPTGQA